MDVVDGNRHIYLLLPPVWDVDAPYIALPLLTAALRGRGIPVWQEDLNIEWYQEVLSAKGLSGVADRLDELLGDDSLPDEHRRELAVSRAALPLVMNRIDQAKLAATGSTDLEVIRRSKALIEWARRIVSALFWPTQVTSDSYRSARTHECLRDVLAASVDRNANPFWEFFLEKLRVGFAARSVALVGISIVGESQVVPSLTLARVSKVLRPEVPVVIGGPMLPYMQRGLMSVPEAFDVIDYAIVGEGETALAELYHTSLSMKSDATVVNCIVRTGEVVRHLGATRVEDPNDCPSPDYGGLRLDDYCAPQMLPVLGSRGCYWGRCAFCSLSTEGAHRYRQRSMSRIDEDVARAICAGATIIAFHDECVSAPRLRALTRVMRRHHQQKDVIWLCLCRFEPALDSKVLGAAKAAGLRWISWGLESASPSTLQLMRKGIMPSIAAMCLEASHRHGVWNHVFIMSQFPNARPDDLVTTLAFVSANRNHIDTLGVAPFRLEAGSAIAKHPTDFGVLLEETPSDYILPRLAYRTPIGERHAADPAFRPEDYRLLLSSVCTSRLHVDNYNGVSAAHILERLRDNPCEAKECLRRRVEDELGEMLARARSVSESEDVRIRVGPQVRVMHTYRSDWFGDAVVVDEDRGMFTVVGDVAGEMLQHARDGVQLSELLDETVRRCGSRDTDGIRASLRELVIMLAYQGYVDVQ